MFKNCYKVMEKYGLYNSDPVIRTYSGLWVNVFNPTPEMFIIEDIATLYQINVDLVDISVNFILLHNIHMNVVLGLMINWELSFMMLLKHTWLMFLDP